MRPSPRQGRSSGPKPFKGTRHRKFCAFCVDKVDFIDYKNIARLRRHVNDRAKILPRRVTGTCAKHQRLVAVAVKRAREIALLPFVAD
jgi:small subunit ribosomal protein S18